MKTLPNEGPTRGPEMVGVLLLSALIIATGIATCLAGYWLVDMIQRAAAVMP